MATLATRQNGREAKRQYIGKKAVYRLDLYYYMANAAYLNMFANESVEERERRLKKRKDTEEAAEKKRKEHES